MIILGLGSNIGDRRDHLRRAVQALNGEDRVAVRRVSPVYESDALLLPEAKPEWSLPYLNCAVEVVTTLEPMGMLALIKRLEQRLGREDRGRWAPREIDIDILVWHEMEIADEVLRVPHSGLLERPFALLPLTDLTGSAGQARHREAAATWRNQEPCKRPFNTRSIGLLYPEWVGIVNVTPDSFSDGGHALETGAAVRQAVESVEHGAAVIDIGAESTRPGAELLTPQAEWERLAPVLPPMIKALRGLPQKPRISVDTRSAITAERCLALGIDWLNDVGGLEAPEMRRVAAASGVDVVVMNSLGLPASRERVLDQGCDPVAEVLRWARKKLDELEAAGIARERVIVDPGIGFGKSAWQNKLLVEGAHRLHELGVRILCGHSRKSFLSLFTQKPPAERDFETATVSVELARRGVDYLRVHNIEVNRQAVDIAGAINGCVDW